MSNLFSNECEQAVIGELLIDSDSFDKISDIIDSSCFYSIANKTTYLAIETLLNANKPCDVMTVSNALTLSGNINDVGGIPYLTGMMELAAGSLNVVDYADIIKERSVLRGLNSVCGDVIHSLSNPSGVDVETLLEGAQAGIMALTDSTNTEEGFVDGNDLVKAALLGIDTRFNSDSTLTGVDTGFEDLNEITGGWQKTDLIIIGARPSMGKTTLAMNFVHTAITSQPLHVCVFSLEVPRQELINKMLCSGGRIDASRMKTGKLEGDDWAKLSSAVNKITDKNFSIDDASGISPAYMRNKLRKQLREKGKIGMIMIDYLQLMKIKGFSEGRQQEISEISRQLKALAKEFDCPVVALSQLNRSLEQRPDKRPINSDLRESGAIEQDADVITFIYRDEVYNDDTPDKGTAEILIRKHRNGQVGMVRLSFLGKYSTFTNHAYDNGEY